MKYSNEKNLLILMLGALGVVFGDIGTSPLYALKSCFSITEVSVTEANILGVVSLFFWLLIFVVNLKYIILVMRCDQQGEGGVLVLSSLLSKLKQLSLNKIVLVLGVIAMASFFADSIITPAISVLSATEGLKLIIPISQNLVVSLSIIIIFLLFFFQSKGSAVLGNFFGYIMVCWFATIALLGLIQIIKIPHILAALNPFHAIKFLAINGISSLKAIGAAILIVTGAEALYADMGHFGKKPIQKSWMYFVLPSLALNYFGQGALLLENSEHISNPFFFLAHDNFILPLTILSVAATIIASQAVISGLFSLTWQAIMLNYLPRMRVIHTSEDQRGQIYIPVINYILCFLSIIAIIIFKTSDNLASAYGLSVAAVMLITSFFASLIALFKWKWHLVKIVIVFCPLILLDLAFVITNIAKLIEGAWYTLVIACIVAYLVLVWHKGSNILASFKQDSRVSLADFLKTYVNKTITRIPGCAIFMTRTEKVVPFTLETQLKHNQFLHEIMIFVNIVTEAEPKIESENKYSVEKFLDNIYFIKAHFGFSERPNLLKITNWLIQEKIIQNQMVSVFLGRGIPIPTKYGRLGIFEKKLYAFFARNSLPIYDFYKINFDQVIELGIRHKV